MVDVTGPVSQVRDLRWWYMAGLYSHFGRPGVFVDDLLVRCRCLLQQAEDLSPFEKGEDRIARTTRNEVRPQSVDGGL